MNADGVCETDVVVVGGGPGGSTLATLVAMRGHRVVLLEKEKFPRYQIGESLLPSTVHGICRLTGVADKLAKAGFTKKTRRDDAVGGDTRALDFRVLGITEDGWRDISRLSG